MADDRMIVRADDLTIVEIDGLPEGAVFCGPITAAVVRACGQRCPDLQQPGTRRYEQYGPYISNVREVLVRLVRHWRLLG